MTPALFCKVGEALFGPAWRAALADALGNGERTVRRWADGDSAMPDGLRSDLAKLCRSRAAALTKLADQLERD